MVYDGVEYKPWRDGSFRCPWKCGRPDYPQRKWRSEKGFLKHLDECSMNPRITVSLQNWNPEPPEARTKFGTCEDCGGLVWRYDSIWQMRERWVCFGCREEYVEAGNGYLDCAGLELPRHMLEGF